MVSPEYKEELCKELNKKSTDAQWEAREELNELFEAYDEIKNDADDIREAHDFFDETNLTDEEIIDKQIDLIDTARSETADKIGEVNEEMEDDWGDAHGAGADAGERERLNSLETYMGQLDEVKERLENDVRYFREQRDEYDKASEAAGTALDDWDEHCGEDPPEEEESEKPRRPDEPDEEDQGGFGGEDPNP